MSPEKWAAADRFVRRVRARVPAALVQASLFGSQARGEARPDSDVDVLLIFRRLPWDREPQASIAEDLADEVARETGTPVTSWSVSLVDLEQGRRTPMLVDAMEDGVPIWARSNPLPPVAFTPDDALFCVERLMERLAEGADELRHHQWAGDHQQAQRRARDDLARVCVAGLLVRGVTRPRRAEAIRRFRQMVWPDGRAPGLADAAMEWAIRSYGASGKDEEIPVGPPPVPLGEVAALIARLEARVRRETAALAAGTPKVWNHSRGPDIGGTGLAVG